jgi:excisionase family DNA binding protein
MKCIDVTWIMLGSVERPEKPWQCTHTIDHCATVISMPAEITWLSTNEAAARLGVSLRTLYKFIDEGQVPAYKFGRVIRLQAAEVDGFISGARIEPGTLEHLYPESKVGD